METRATKPLFSEFGPNSGYISELYDLYSTNSSLVSAPWAQFFRSFKDQIPQIESSSVNGKQAQAHVPPSIEKTLPAADIDL